MSNVRKTWEWDNRTKLWKCGKNGEYSQKNLSLNENISKHWKKKTKDFSTITYHKFWLRFIFENLSNHLKNLGSGSELFPNDTLTGEISKIWLDYWFDDVPRDLSGSNKMFDVQKSMKCIQETVRFHVGWIDGDILWKSWEFNCWYGSFEIYLKELTEYKHPTTIPMYLLSSISSKKCILSIIHLFNKNNSDVFWKLIINN